MGKHKASGPPRGAPSARRKRQKFPPSDEDPTFPPSTWGREKQIPRQFLGRRPDHQNLPSRGAQRESHSVVAQHPGRTPEPYHSRSDDDEPNPVAYMGDHPIDHPITPCATPTTTTELKIRGTYVGHHDPEETRHDDHTYRDVAHGNNYLAEELSYIQTRMEVLENRYSRRHAEQILKRVHALADDNARLFFAMRDERERADDYRSKLDLQEMEITDQAAKLVNAMKTKSALAGQIEDLCKAIKDQAEAHKKEVEGLAADKEKLSKAIAELKSSYKTLSDRNKELSGHIDKHTSAASAQKEEKDGLVQDAETFRTAKEALGEEHKRLQQQSEELRAQLQDQQEKASMLDEEKTRLQKSTGELESQLHEKAAATNKLEEEKATLQQSSKELLVRLRNQEDMVEKLEIEKTVLRREKKELHHKHAKGAEALQKSIKKLEEKVRNLDAENLSLRKSHEQHRMTCTKCSETDGWTVKVRQQVKVWIDRAAELSLQKQTLEEANQALKNELNKGQRQLQQHQSGSGLEEKDRKWPFEKTETLQEQIDKLKTEAAEWEEEKADLVRDLGALRETNQVLEGLLKTHVETATSKDNEVAALMGEVATLKETNAKLEQDLESEKETASKQEAKAAALSIDLKASKREIQKLTEARERQDFIASIDYSARASLVKQLGSLEQDKKKLQEKLETLEGDATRRERSVQEAQATQRELETSLQVKGDEIETLKLHQQKLQEELEMLKDEATRGKKSIQEAQAKQRELESTLQAKEIEIEALKLRPAHGDEGYITQSDTQGGTQGGTRGSTHSLLAGSRPASLFIKSERSTDTESADGLPDSSARGSMPPVENTLRDFSNEEQRTRYMQLGRGVAKLLSDQIGITTVFESLQSTEPPTEIVMEYLTALGAIEKPVQFRTMPGSNLWKMKEPWLVTAATRLSVRADVKEALLQLCFLLPALREQDAARVLPSVANIVTFLIEADYSVCPSAGAAFLKAMASLRPPERKGVFRARNVVVSILICELCRRLEDVLAVPFKDLNHWTVSSILGPAVHEQPELRPILKLAETITRQRNLPPAALRMKVEEEWRDQFCVVSTSALGEPDVGFLYCGDRQSFLKINFTERNFRLVDCQLALSRPNQEEPRKQDLTIERQGEELYRLPKAPRNIALFWLRYAIAYDY